MMQSTVHLMDCMEGMKQFPDKWFDLACVDPPYGIGEDGKSNHSRVQLSKPKLYTPKNWDREVPSKEYFHELIRVSKNQIVWGANHFISRLPYDSTCWLVWDKLNSGDFADCELAWTSFVTSVRKFTYRWNGMLQGNMKDKESRIHPTQKPIALYDWIYANYLPEGGKVLDSHIGSGSNRIAAWKAGNIDFTGYEIDPDYHAGQEKRFKEFTSQPRLFHPSSDPKQMGIL